MIVIVLALVFGVLAALGTAGPVGANEIRRGRASYLELTAERAALGRLADWHEEPWLDSTRGRPAGARITFTPELLAPGVLATRVLEEIGPGLWLLEVRAAVQSQAGADRAVAVRGWLVRVDSLPTDSIPRFGPVARPRLTGLQ